MSHTIHGTNVVHLPTWMVDLYAFHVGTVDIAVTWMVWVLKKNTHVQVPFVKFPRIFHMFFPVLAPGFLFSIHDENK